MITDYLINDYLSHEWGNTCHVNASIDTTNCLLTSGMMLGRQCMPPWMLGQLAKLEVELFVIQKLWGHLSESNWWAEISNLQSTWNIASYPGSFLRRKRKWAWVQGNVEHTFTCTKHHQYKRCEHNCGIVASVCGLRQQHIMEGRTSSSVELTIGQKVLTVESKDIRECTIAVN